MTSNEYSKLERLGTRNSEAKTVLGEQLPNIMQKRSWKDGRQRKEKRKSEMTKEPMKQTKEIMEVKSDKKLWEIPCERLIGRGKLITREMLKNERKKTSSRGSKEM
jgi:hypothetical protein